MTASGCSAPVPFAVFVEYWFGELAQDDEDRVEEHVLGCAECSERLEGLAKLGAGIRSAFRGGEVWAVISPALLLEMKQQGLRLREYPVAPGGSVNCTVGTDDDAVVSRLQVALEGETRVDLVYRGEHGEGRLPDIPFEPGAGEVLFCPPAASLKKSSAHTAVIRLLAVGESGDREIADFTFVHTPS